MSQDTYIPSGPTFIANVQAGTQFSANLTANAPVSYVRVSNFGDQSGTNFISLWTLLTANTAPQSVEFSAPNDPAWTGQNNGTLIVDGQSVIIAINNGQGNKSATELQFIANADPYATATFATVAVQPVIPI